MITAKDVERLFLQAVFSRGVLSGKLAQLLWEKCVDAVRASGENLDIPHSKDKASWEGFVVKINKSLNDLDLEFRHLHDETTGKEMYALVNRKGDEIAQMATDYTPGEITYFKAIIEQIMLAPRESFSVSSLAALREVNSIKPKSNMSKTQAETVLGSFVAKGWLLRSKRGRYSLSTRSLLELQPYLKSTYPDEIVECTICMEMITRGVACLTSNCQTRMHNHCYNKYKARNSGCPTCKKAWPQDAKDLVPVGEGAAREGEDAKRRTRARSESGSDDEDEQMDDEGTSQTQTQSQPRTQRTTRARKAKAAADASMEVDEDE